jgi:hypothetical protein
MLLAVNTTLASKGRPHVSPSTRKRVLICTASRRCMPPPCLHIRTKTPEQPLASKAYCGAPLGTTIQDRAAMLATPPFSSPVTSGCMPSASGGGGRSRGVHISPATSLSPWPSSSVSCRVGRDVTQSEPVRQMSGRSGTRILLVRLPDLCVLTGKYNEVRLTNCSPCHGTRQVEQQAQLNT